MRRRSRGKPEVARGVHRLGTHWANFYLVVDEVSDQGRQLTAEDRRVLGGVRKRIADASNVAAEYAAPERERERWKQRLCPRRPV